MEVTAEQQRIITECFAELASYEGRSAPRNLVPPIEEPPGFGAITLRLRSVLMSLEPVIPPIDPGKPSDPSETEVQRSFRLLGWPPEIFRVFLRRFSWMECHKIRHLIAGKRIGLGGWRNMQLVNGRLQDLSPPLSFEASGRLDAALGFVLRIEPFPYRQCANCRKVFIRQGRQIYCSKQCSGCVAEKKRAGTRNEYMRNYMSNRRTREREKQERESIKREAQRRRRVEERQRSYAR